MSGNNWENQFNNAETNNNSSEYMREGNWLIRIDKVARGENRKKVGNFKLEGTVVHHFEGNHAVGESITDMYTEQSDYFFQEVKALIAALAGTDATKVTYDDLLKVAGEDQPLKGIVIEYSAYKKDPEKVFVKTVCKGMITEEKWKAVALPENIERFENLRFSSPE